MKGRPDFWIALNFTLGCANLAWGAIACLAGTEFWWLNMSMAPISLGLAAFLFMNFYAPLRRRARGISFYGIHGGVITVPRVGNVHLWAIVVGLRGPQRVIGIGRMAFVSMPFTCKVSRDD